MSVNMNFLKCFNRTTSGFGKRASVPLVKTGDGTAASRGTASVSDSRFSSSVEGRAVGSRKTPEEEEAERLRRARVEEERRSQAGITHLYVLIMLKSKQYGKYEREFGKTKNEPYKLQQ